MALSYQAETSDGTLKRVILGIDFFDTSDIYVTQGDKPLSTPADYQWDGRTAINLTEVVPAGVLLMVRRRTDNTVTRLKFSQGAPFVRENIDAQNKQFLFLAQEAAEGAFGDLYNNLNMHNFRIFNLAEPTDDKDAATKGWAVRTFSGIYNEYLALCKHEADRAVDAANRANVSANKAEVSANTAKSYADAAGESQLAAGVSENNAYRSEMGAASDARASAASAAESEASAKRAENAADAITGAILDGGACDLSGGVYPPPLEIKGEKYSTVWAVTVGGTVEGTVYLAGDGLRYTVNGNYYFRVDVTGEVKAQITAHEKKLDAHPISGVAGLSAALDSKQDKVDAYEAPPFPDVWIPLSDGLTMLAGYNKYDRVYIGEEYLELNSRSADYECATTASYVNKSEAMCTAAINEPRFERGGLLREPMSTNIVVHTDPANLSAFDGVEVVSFVDSTRKIKRATDTAYWEGYVSSGICSLSFYANPEDPQQIVRVNPSPYDAFLDYYPALGKAVRYNMGPNAPAVDFADVEYVGGGWHRLSMQLELRSNPVRIHVYPQQVNNHCALEGLQIEQSPIPTSFIQTHGTAVTRAADKLTIPKLNNECTEWYSGGDVIIPTVSADTIVLSPPEGKLHLRNVRGFFTPLTDAQKKGLR